MHVNGRLQEWPKAWANCGRNAGAVEGEGAWAGNASYEGDLTPSEGDRTHDPSMRLATKYCLPRLKKGCLNLG